jgi:hypothetical protein
MAVNDIPKLSEIVKQYLPAKTESKQENTD